MSTQENDLIKMDTEAAAAYVGKSASTLEQWRWAGKGPSYIPGKPVFYLKEDLDSYLRNARIHPPNLKLEVGDHAKTNDGGKQ